MTTQDSDLEMKLTWFDDKVVNNNSYSTGAKIDNLKILNLDDQSFEFLSRFSPLQNQLLRLIEFDTAVMKNDNYDTEFKIKNISKS